ncbi:MAG: SMC-Scp complex subunit ScpB, partial [Lachnospiraceae bacterium]|nr:SMC-Scp complex subunit ScpB [Lachnospiraceae bacterium]
DLLIFLLFQKFLLPQPAYSSACMFQQLRLFLRRLRERYDEEDSGMQILRLEDSYQMSTRTKFYSNLIKVAATPKKQVLTDVVMETLAIIAYKQPVTKADIEKIRGVKSDHAVNRLIEYNLVYEAGRMDAPGRPALFATTEEFLRRFGVSSTVELPEMNLEQREEIKSEVEEELNLKLNGDGLPMSDEELAALAEVEAEANSDNVTDDLSEIDYTKEEQELKIKQEEERHEMQ